MRDELLPNLMPNTPEVLVIGSGAMGLLTAHMLREAGASVLVLGDSNPGSGQSSHCHGYMHRGYIYRDLRTETAQLLHASNIWWSEALDASSPAITTKASAVIFHSRKGNHAAVRTWRDLAMPFEHFHCTDIFPWSFRGYLVPERAVTPVIALKEVILPRSGRLPYIHGKAIRLNTDGRRATSVTAIIDGQLSQVHARHYVVNAGLGTLDLVPMARISLQARVSFMLVCQTMKDLPYAFCMPDDDTHGLFAVSRDTKDGRIFLLSNFVSFWPGPNVDIACSRWLAGMARILSRYIPLLWNDPDATWGTYVAPKAELIQSRSRGVPEGGVLPTLMENVTAAVPGKYVLSPIYAKRTVAAVREALASTSVKPRMRLPFIPRNLASMSWAPEDWTTSKMMPRDELLAVQFHREAG